MATSRTGTRLCRVTALALAFTLALTFAVAADAGAAKKKGKGQSRTATIGAVVETAIPDRSVDGPFGTVAVTMPIGKRFRGARVADVRVSFQTTGAAANSAQDLFFSLTAPNGRTLFLFPDTARPDGFYAGQSIGPLTLTSSSRQGLCTLLTPPCDDPFAVLNRPYAGLAGQIALALFEGTKMRGSWTFTAADDDVGGVSTLNSVFVRIKADRAPAARKKKGKKKRRR